ncbi:hypothetical protein GJ654_09905 [Rhodoblastus acidophilus]|uniref:Phage tail lysozyme domain-containing protein n=1 Tax=Rhodoblastus acidophilus TaxID=1074 RepID=A0A6N8DN72_RHOAC|nr:phage tail tip lysozyme [Rhodoblastus acidophilus]MCW2275030.1 hypothetical protein [Rhodoblastus acidophilus]MTV31306.1 hypothetical protein [Rhodoblastus acidophilus]
MTELFDVLRELAGKGARLLETTMDNKAYQAAAATIIKFWTARGLTFEQACGLLAQADAESSLNTKAVGDHGLAFGLHQWHAERVDAIRNGCGVDLRESPPLDDQLKAAFWELTHTEKRAWTAIRQAKSAYDAGYAACRFWERPGAPGQCAKRGQKAEYWENYFSRHPVA